MKITVTEKRVFKGFCRCGCNMTAEILNQKQGANEWYGIQTAQNPVNVHKAHMKNAYGQALNTKTRNSNTSVHTHDVKAVVYVKSGFTAQCIALALRQGAWTVERDSKRQTLTISATLDARQVKLIDTVKDALGKSEGRIRWYLDGEEVSEEALDEQIAATDSRNLHGDDSKAIKRIANRKK